MNRFSVIGAGSLGANLVYALVERGYALQYIFKKAKYSLRGARISADIAQVVQASDFVVISTQESKIGAVSRLIAEKSDPAGKIFFHTANALTSAELSAIKERGGITASFSPLQTFVGFAKNEELFTGIYFLAEGDPKAVALAETIGRDLGARVLVVEKEDKVYFHMAAVSASNFLVALLKFAENQLKKSKTASGIEILLPLVRQTVQNAAELGIDASLSGPIKRKELDIVKQHLQLLHGQDAELYRILSEYLQ